MKQKALIYALVFAILVIIYQLFNAKAVFGDMNNKLGKDKVQLEKYKDSLASMHHKLLASSHFNLEHNEDALSYFEKEGFKIDSLLPEIENQLIKLNEAKGEHPLVPYAARADKRMLINTIKILNHKWIICEFTDGKYWGEMLLNYTVEKGYKVNYKVLDSFLYPFD